MRTVLSFGAIVIVTTALVACGGGGSSSSPAPTPTAPAPTSSAATTVAIVGSSGNAAYSPNPVMVASGGQLVFRNADSTMHHIVLDDGSADLGNLNPGSNTQPVTVRSGNALTYHCTIHPTMVGSINGTAPPMPPNPGDPLPYSAGRR